MAKKKRKKAKAQVSEEEIYVEYDEPSPFMAWFNNFFRSSPRQTQEIDVEEDLPPEKVAELTEMEEEIEDVHEDVDDLEDRRESLLQRFLKSMRQGRSGRADEYEEYEADGIPVVDEEVKEVLKLLHIWLERLPNHELRSFKVSDDFVKYKAMLEKYELIRKP